MNETPNRANADRLSIEEADSALRAVLRDDGRLFPNTEQELRELEKTLDLKGIPTPDVNRFLSKLRQHEIKREKVIPLPTSLEQTRSSVIDENLASAARNGGAITEEVRRAMDADRAEAEKRLQDNKKCRLKSLKYGNG